jgi:tol-pal system protein YbgF
MILFQSRNYPDATLEFSAFVDQYPDHPLAGSAQYYLGESYFKQKEYKLAARELGRVITTYDRSPHIADTLRDLAISEDKIGQTEEAARHRQLLTSLFPHSPAAHSGTAADEAPETESPATAHSPTHSSESGTTSQATKSSQLDAPPPTAPMAPSGPMEHEAK